MELIWKFLVALSVLFTIIGFPLVVFAFLKEREIRPKGTRKRYRSVCGEYRLFNLSMEHFLNEFGEPRLVTWRVTVNSRKLRVPRFKAIYVDSSLDHWNAQFSGNVYISERRVYFLGHVDTSSHPEGDPMLLCFQMRDDKPLDLCVGFYAGYDDRSWPYSGAFLIQRFTPNEKPLSEGEIREVLGDCESLRYEEFTERLAKIAEQRKF